MIFFRRFIRFFVVVGFTSLQGCIGNNEEGMMGVLGPSMLKLNSILQTQNLKSKQLAPKKKIGIYLIISRYMLKVPINPIKVPEISKSKK